MGVMGLTASTKNNKSMAAGRSVLTASAAMLLLGGNGALAAEIGADLRVGVSNTDNVFLSSAGNEVSDTVFSAAPTLTLVHNSPQWDADILYSLQWYKYDDLGTTSTFHNFDGSVTGKLLEESVALEVGGSRSQVLRDPENIAPTGRLPISGNLLDRDRGYVDLRINRDLGRAATVTADYRFTTTGYDDSTIQENDDQHARFSLENYRAREGFTWALRYDWRETEYENSIPWEYQQASAELGAWLNAKTRLFASGGKESAWDQPFDSSLEDTFWEGGFAHDVGESVKVEFAAGERSFGSSWRGDVEYEFRRGSTSFSYNEMPTTIGFDRRGLGNGLDTVDIEDFLTRPGTAERYLSKRLQWNLDLNFRRTEFGLIVFGEERNDRIQPDGSTLDDQEQTGVRARFAWQAGVRTEFVATGSIVDRETGIDEKSENIAAGLDINYRIGNRTRLTLGYSYAEQEPESGTASRDYVSNIVSLFVTYVFL